MAGQVPARAAALLRSDIADVTAEIVREIQTQIPEYVRPGDDNYTRTVEQGVGRALRRYVDLIENGADADDGWRATFRAIGAGEVREGRSLDALHAAILIGGRVASRRLRLFAERESLPRNAVAELAETIFENLDDIAHASADGFAEAHAVETGEFGRRRRRLMEVLLAEPAASPEAVSAAAAAARWRLPDRLVAVALDERVAPGPPPILGSEILADFERAAPCLIVPVQPGDGRFRAMIAAAVGRGGAAGRGVAVGPEVDSGGAANSLRWARRALGLARRGVIAVDADGIVHCDDHLATLAVFQDEDLLGALAERRLAPLAGLPAGKRQLLVDTLLAWLRLNMNTNDVAEYLHVHPQTVRHRLRQLAGLFGDQIRDPDQRFELQLALRGEFAGRDDRAIDC